MLPWRNTQFWRLRWPTLSAGPTPLSIVLHLHTKRDKYQSWAREEPRQTTLTQAPNGAVNLIGDDFKGPQPIALPQLKPSNPLYFSCSCRNSSSQQQECEPEWKRCLLSSKKETLNVLMLYQQDSPFSRKYAILTSKW